MLEALVSLSLLCTGCGPRFPVTQSVLSDGTLLADLVVRPDTVIALFSDPADCFVCASSVPRWREWAQRGHGRGILLILTRKPTRVERELLVLNRLQKTPWLLDDGPIKASPAALAFVLGRVVDSAAGRVGASQFFVRWVVDSAP